MKNKILPKRLRKEPLLDAIFEFRFDSNVPVANILPGLMFAQLDGQKTLERLPQSEIPEQIRNSDPSLQHLPLIKLNWNDYSIMIGDKSLSIAVRLPYKGWADFRVVIIKSLKILKESTLISKIERYSAKYIDFIDASLIESTHKATSIAVSIGSKNLTENTFHLRVEMPIDGFTNVVQIVSSASVKLTDGSSRQGLVIDIDTVKFNNDLLSLEDLDVEKSLNEIHEASKVTFFECLTDETLTILEPEYE